MLPYLAGANTLDNDPHARGSIAGLTLDTTKPQLTRAFLEAAGYELRYLVDAFEHSGIPVGRVRVVGGGVANRSAVQIRASAADLPLVLHFIEHARGQVLDVLSRWPSVVSSEVRPLRPAGVPRPPGA